MSLQSELGADACELVELYESDLQRHEDAVGEHNRTVLTIRGFAITAVAALIAGTYASRRWEPAAAGAMAALYFAFLDYYNSRLYIKVEQRIPLLESIAQSYRNLGSASRSRRRREVPELQTYLRAYSPRVVIPRRPELKADFKAWLSTLRRHRQAVKEAKAQDLAPPKRQRIRTRGSDSFRQFAGIYVLLTTIATLSAFTLNGDSKEKIILCQSSNGVRVMTNTQDTQGCPRQIPHANPPARQANGAPR